jgi:dTDP-4-dehydrorhamnose reductase
MNTLEKVVLIGARGQLGTDCHRAFRAQYRVDAFDLPELDVRSCEAIREVLHRTRPDVIVNCSAFTQVDLCETERDAAFAVNATGAQHLAKCALEMGSFLIHMSTDYVFDGQLEQGRAYTEADTPNPVTVYGKTKWAGEQAIQESMQQYAILRTAWLYGASGHNFLKTILRRTVQAPKTPLRIVDDQYGCPTWSHRLAAQIVKVINERCTGVFHATAHGSTSWYGLATAFLEQMGISHPIEPCSSDEYPTPARRPRNSVLDNARLRSAELDIMRNWEADLCEFSGKHRDHLLQEARISQS